MAFTITALDKVIAAISPGLQEQLQVITSFAVSDFQDDRQFGALVSKPALLSVSATSGGTTKLISGFDDRFMQMMLHLRNELIDLSGAMPQMQAGFQQRLPRILREGLKH